MKKVVLLSICLLLLSVSTVRAQISAESTIGQPESSHETSLHTSQDALQDDEPTLINDLVAGNNEFAFDLYHAIRENDGNMFYSPYSISNAFAMVYAGAKGNTEQEMAATLHYNLPQEELHPTFGSLNADLTQPISGTEEMSFTLNIANSLWPQVGYPLQQSFLDVVSEDYGSDMQEVDYIDATKREEARLTINDWISEKTAGKFEEMIPTGVLNSNTRLALVNATYFKAEWVEYFEEAINAEFTLFDDSTVTVPMMHTEQSFDYTDAQGYQAVALPYKGNRMQMVIILPDQGEFTQIENQFDPAFLHRTMDQFEQRNMILRLPKFDYEANLNLASTLSTMCMTDAFSSAADFSGIDGSTDLSIDKAQHKASITVDESGTEAVGVTVITIGPVSAPSLFVDVARPFIFLIHDKDTDSILFMGRVFDPLAGGMEIEPADSNSIDCSAGFSRGISVQRSIFLPIVD